MQFCHVELNPIFDADKTKFMRRAIRRQPIARPPIAAISTYCNELREVSRKPSYGIECSAPVQAIIRRRKRNGSQREVVVLNPFLSISSLTSFAEYADALKQWPGAYGHFPYRNNVRQEYNSKADQMLGSIASYESHEYPAFIRDLEQSTKNLPSSYICLRADVQSCYPSIPQDVLAMRMSLVPIDRDPASILELNLQRFVSTSRNQGQIGITIDNVGLHACVLAGYVLTRIDESVAEAVGDSFLRMIRFMDDIFIIGPVDLAYEIFELIASELQTMNMQLNGQKNIEQSPIETRQDFGLDLTVTRPGEDLDCAASQLLNSKLTCGSRIDSLVKYWLFLAAKSIAFGRPSIELASRALADEDLVESLNYRQVIALNWTAMRIFGSLHSVISTLERLSDKWTYATVVHLAAARQLQPFIPAINEISSLLEKRALATDCLHLLDSPPSQPRLIA